MFLCTALAGGPVLVGLVHHLVELGGDERQQRREGRALRAHLQGTRENSRLEAIQKSLIALMGELATLPEDSARYASSKFDKLAAGDIQQLDSWIAEHEASGLTFEGWALPGGTIASAHLDMARTICRRAERSTVALRSPETNESSQAVVYLNRLSDLLWLMARSVEQSPESSQLA